MVVREMKGMRLNQSFWVVCTYSAYLLRSTPPVSRMCHDGTSLPVRHCCSFQQQDSFGFRDSPPSTSPTRAHTRLICMTPARTMFSLPTVLI